MTRKKGTSPVRSLAARALAPLPSCQSSASANCTTRPRRRAMSMQCLRTVSAWWPTVTTKRRISTASCNVHITRSASVKPSTRVRGFGRLAFEQSRVPGPAARITAISGVAVGVSAAAIG